MLESHEYLKMLIGLLAIVNPIGAMPIFLSLTYQYDEGTRRRIARIAATAVFVILTVSLLIGENLLTFFGITIDSFRVAGGILLLLMAIAMLHAKPSGTTRTKEELHEGEAKDSVAVVPLSMPILAGPGAISTVILYAHRGDGVGHYSYVVLDLFILSLSIWLVFHITPWISSRIGNTAINVFTRVMGLILAAIAIEFMANGLKGLFPVLT